MATLLLTLMPAQADPAKVEQVRALTVLLGALVVILIVIGMVVALLLTRRYRSFWLRSGDGRGRRRFSSAWVEAGRRAPSHGDGSGSDDDTVDIDPDDLSPDDVPPPNGHGMGGRG